MLDCGNKKKKYSGMLSALIKKMDMMDMAEKDEDEEEDKVSLASSKGEEEVSDAMEDGEPLLSESGKMAGLDEENEDDGAFESLSKEEIREILSDRNRAPKKKEGMVTVSIAAMSPKAKAKKSRSKGKIA